MGRVRGFLAGPGERVRLLPLALWVGRGCGALFVQDGLGSCGLAPLGDDGGAWVRGPLGPDAVSPWTLSPGLGGAVECGLGGAGYGDGLGALRLCVDVVTPSLPCLGGGSMRAGGAAGWGGGAGDQARLRTAIRPRPSVIRSAVPGSGTALISTTKSL